ncbi:MAG TPA: sugar transferase [Acidimicrobiales bacterium]|nr:sugar transferase [Acidimicrobiales bacterium]
MGPDDELYSAGPPVPAPPDRDPWWMDAVEAVRTAAPSPLTAFFDGAVCAAVAWSIDGVRRGGTQAATLFVLAGVISDLYRRRSRAESAGVGWYAARAAVPAAALFFVAWAAPPVLRGGWTAPMALASALACWSAVVGCRWAMWRLVAWMRRGGAGTPHPTLLVGSAGGVAAAARLLADPAYGLSHAGTHLCSAADALLAGAAPPALGRYRQVLVAGGEEAVGAYLRMSRAGGPPVALVVPRARLRPDAFRARMGPLAVFPLRGQPAVQRRAAKRALDLVGATVALVVGLPVMAAVAGAVWLDDRAPVLFRQPRVGAAGRMFAMVKFRTMQRGAEEQAWVGAARRAADGLLFKPSDDPRVLAVGAVLRRLALDELPQLVNVLRGQMSLVGPRPLPVEPERFSPAASARHRVRPGITGLWQVEGGNALSYAEMIELDIAYLAGWSVSLDLWLLVRTPLALVFPRPSRAQAAEVGWEREALGVATGPAS